MIGSFSRAIDNLFGRGEAAVTVPPFDGALRPNRALDEAAWRMAVPEVDCLAVHAGTLVASAGNTVYAIASDGSLTPHRTYDARIVCLAAFGNDGLAVALDDGHVVIEGGAYDHRRYRVEPAACITAMAASEGALYVANGSASNGPDEWQRDLLERNSSGSIWRIHPENGASQCIADGLAWPSGLALDASGVVYSEAWRHSLVRIGAEGGRTSTVLQSDLPGYPGRLSSSVGGWWLAVFAPRSQLVEFVLREPGYRKRMMAEVPRDYWVAPKLKSGRSYYEPLQGGGVKHLGLLKPWAPTMSFGLCVWLDAAFQPRASLQSRADGNTHGITSVIEHKGAAVAAARGDDIVVRLPSPVDMLGPGA